jgi:hypothetical protein|tara:strand:- start:1473 stop:1856 length:384 start_codon:yes stop_codon:yes gene_type:complete
MTKSTLGDIQDDLDSFDFHETMEYVAALTGSDEVMEYKNILNRSKVISSIASAKILSNILTELTSIVAYTPAIIRPTPLGQMLRTTLSDSVEALDMLREAMVESHNDDEGYTDKKIIDTIKANAIQR